MAQLTIAQQLLGVEILSESALSACHGNVSANVNIDSLAKLLRKQLMTMPCERTRAVIHTRKFLEELSRDPVQTEAIRKSAVGLLRHYPSNSEILLVGKIQERCAEQSIYPPIFSSTIE